MNREYRPPEFEAKGFNCPHCNVSANQKWIVHIACDVELKKRILDGAKSVDFHQQPGVVIAGAGDTKWEQTIETIHIVGTKLIHIGDISICDHCKKFALWINAKMIYPNVITAPIAHADMPSDVKKIYEEARAVSSISPRASAALLRVTLEKLTEHLGETKGSLNERIKNLKKQGLPQKVIDSLDIVRIIANEGGSHAGQIDLTGSDNPEIVNTLFWLTNFIIEKTITEDRKIEEMRKNLPEDKKEGIKNRDSQN